MADLEQRLRALAADAFPPAPDVRAAVAARVAAQRPAAQLAGGAPEAVGTGRPGARRTLAGRRRARRAGTRRGPGETARARWSARRRVLALALAFVLVPTAALAAVPTTRHAILEWLGLEHVRVERVPAGPRLPPLERADLGRRVASVQDAERLAGFAVEVPRALGAPDAVYVTEGGVVSLAYDPRPGLPRDRQTGLGLLVTELRATGVTQYVAKMIGPDTRLERVRVGGAPGVFLSGAPHELLIERPPGVVRPLRQRLAGNTLAFERRDLVLRVEGRIGRDRALAVARSLRAGGG